MTKPEKYETGEFEGELTRLLALQSQLAEAECNAVGCNTAADHRRVHKFREQFEEHQAYFIVRWDRETPNPTAMPTTVRAMGILVSHLVGKTSTVTTNEKSVVITSRGKKGDTVATLALDVDAWNGRIGDHWQPMDTAGDLASFLEEACGRLVPIERVRAELAA